MNDASTHRTQASRKLLLAALGASLGACAQTPPAPDRAEAPAWLTVARPLGTQQCGDRGTATAELLAASLRTAGVQAQALRCGHDGRMRPQMCGAPDGRLVIADVPAAQQEAAHAQGFLPLSKWPDARSEPCR